MPTYDYKCDACGPAFEQFQSMTAAPIRKCPKCKKNKVKRLIGTGAGLIFKGSGFYITDYRDAGYKEKAKADSGASSDGKSETKTETKADSKSGGGESSKSTTTPTETKPAAKTEPAPAPKPEPKPEASR